MHRALLYNPPNVVFSVHVFCIIVSKPLVRFGGWHNNEMPSLLIQTHKSQSFLSTKKLPLVVSSLETRLQFAPFFCMLFFQRISFFELYSKYLTSISILHCICISTKHFRHNICFLKKYVTKS